MTIPLTPEEIRDDVVAALVDDGYLPTEARVVVSLCSPVESYSELYKEALTRIRAKHNGAQAPASTAGNSVSKGGRGESPEPSAEPSRSADVSHRAARSPKPTQEKTTMANKCPCGATLHAKAIALGKCKACRDAEKKQAKEAAGGAAPKKKRTYKKTDKRRVPPPPHWPDDLATEPGDEIATLSFSGKQLDSMFLSLPLPQKAECLQGWLTRTAPETPAS